MSRTLNRPAPNSFRFLVEDEDDEENNYQQQQDLEKKQAEQKEAAITPGVKRAPLTLSQSLRRSLQNQEVADVNQLAKVVDASIRIRLEERNQYCEKFESYDKFDPQKYEELLEKRLQCFESRRNDEEFIIDLVALIPKDITSDSLLQLLQNVCKTLSMKKPIGHGSLFLLDVLLEHRPNLFKVKLFENLVNKCDVEQYGPVICWIIGRSLKDHSQVTFKTNELFNIFLNDLLSESASTHGPISVCASHLISNCFKKNRDKILSARNAAKLLRINSRKLSNRDKHVHEVLNDLASGFAISDPENYAKELILEEGDQISHGISGIFLKGAMHSQKFVEGWIKCHEEFADASKIHLDFVSRTYPQILDKFPSKYVDKWDNEFAQLTLKQKALNGSSIRFTVILATASAVYYLFNYLN